MDEVRGRALREAVALVLRVAGHSDAEPRVGRRKPSERLLGAEPQPDVLGLDDVWLDVRSDVGSRWSGALDAAEEGARKTGRRWAAVAQPRQARGPGDSFVLMSVGTFADLLKEASHDLVR